LRNFPNELNAGLGLHRHSGLGLSGVAVFALLVAGCAGNQQSGQGQQGGVTVRQSVETAPADLQLLCASEAAKRLGLEPTGVLPVRSQKEGTGFRVVLTASGSEWSCLVDQSGDIISIG
jgi:hypothetical protein